MPTRLDYVSGASILPPDHKFKISPSAINKFFAKPHEWFRSEVLGEDTFLGNTASVLGTIVHFCAEEYSKTEKVDVAEIEKYIASIDNPDVDVQYISEQWKPMGQALIDYLRTSGLPQRSEELIHYEVQPGYFVAGSADAVIGDCLVDYKSCSQLNPPTEIPPYYRYQLLTYAYIYNKLSIPINRIRIVWITNNVVGRISEKTGKPMKDYPATVGVCTETITNDDLDFIESILKLICETVETYYDNPNLAYLLFRDYRLKKEQHGS
jgi:hypothetical protein